MDEDISLEQQASQHRSVLTAERQRNETNKATAAALQSQLRKFIRNAMQDEHVSNNIARDLYEARTHRPPADSRNAASGFQARNEIVTGFEERKFQDDDFNDPVPNPMNQFRFPR